MPLKHQGNIIFHASNKPCNEFEASLQSESDKFIKKWHQIETPFEKRGKGGERGQSRMALH